MNNAVGNGDVDKAPLVKGPTNLSAAVTPISSFVMIAPVPEIETKRIRQS
jgi:hypothetical protein